MANRRPRFGGIACLHCESRLLPSPANRRFSRLASPPLARPRTGSVALPIRACASSATRHLHKSGIAGDSGGKKDIKGNKGSSHPLSDLVVDEVLLDDELIDEPLLDETVSQAAADQIWTSLLGDEGEPTEDDIFQYIDELQPTDDKVLPQSVYEHVARSLSEGFTTTQLLSYVRKHRKSTNPPTVYPWEVRRRPWVPDTPTPASSNSYQFLNEKKQASRGGGEVKAVGPGSALLLQGYISSLMTNKDKVVAQLLRECWGVAISEVMEAPGKLLVAVRDVEYALLEGGAQSWLRDIATAFSTVTTTTATASKSSSRSTSKGQSRHNRRIELLPEKRMLRVCAPASVADAMMAEIDRVLQGTVTARFSLGDVARPGVTISPEALKAVGALTGSWVRLGGEAGGAAGEQAQPDVHVSWVAPALALPSGQKSTEDTGDVVFRLLRHTFGPAADGTTADGTTADSATTLRIDYWPLKKSKGRFLASENSGIHRTQLGWHDRLSRWARWIEPTPEARASTAARKTTGVPGPRALPFDFTLDQAPATHDTHDQQQNWYETVQTSTVTVFGRVLHRQDHGTRAPVYGAGGTVPPDEPPQRLPDVRRVLSATTPPLLGMDLVGDADAEITSSTTVVLRLLPDSKDTASAGAPSIEVILDASAEDGAPAAAPVLTAVRVITATSVCDTLFPTQPVDARTTQQAFYELPGADLVSPSSGPMAPLLAFLEQSQLQLDSSSSSNNFIATPLRLHQLGLPRAVLPPLVGGTGRGAGEGDLVYMTYLFAGAEVRRRVATAFQGWTLGLTSVQTGPGQGQWTELSLEAVPRGTGTGEHTKDSFRQAVGALVHGKTIKWQMPIGEVLC